MNQLLKTKKGFTLMELLTVVIIIGILSSVALPQYRKVIERSRFTKAQVMAKSLYDSCERLVAEWGGETYGDLQNMGASARQAHAQGIRRFDVGGVNDLPAGIRYVGNNVRKLQGSGFEYTMGTSNCSVVIRRTVGPYQDTTIWYAGGQFIKCTSNTDGCYVYGVQD